jgi:hypothetical protein
VNRPAALLTLAALAACKKELPNPDNLMDTGWFTDADVPACTPVVQSITPAEGVTDWYWRDAPRVAVTARDAAFTVRLIEASGKEIPTTAAWSDTTISFDLRFDGGLSPDTEHVLQITDCSGTHERRFTTSSFGHPIDGGPSALAGNTYNMDLFGATWIQPARLGGIIGLYFQTPVLVGVEWAASGRIDLLGAPGYTDYQGRILQDDDQPTWDFPLSSFDDAPYFSNEAAVVNLDLSGYSLPIHYFALSGTFTADGSAFGGGTLSGIGDTRDLGGLLLQPGNNNAVCNLAAGLNVPCIPCPSDNEPYCLAVSLEDVDGTRLDDVRLERTAP